jgi:hypothetical protein
VYLQNAAYKKNEGIFLIYSATNIQRMGLKNEMMAGQLKTMQNNQQLANTFNKIGQIANQMNPNF